MFFSGFLFYDKEGKPLVALHWQNRFNNMVKRYDQQLRVMLCMSTAFTMDELNKIKNGEKEEKVKSLARKTAGCYHHVHERSLIHQKGVYG